MDTASTDSTCTPAPPLPPPPPPPVSDTGATRTMPTMVTISPGPATSTRSAVTSTSTEGGSAPGAARSAGPAPASASLPPAASWRRSRCQSTSTAECSRGAGALPLHPSVAMQPRGSAARPSGKRAAPTPPHLPHSNSRDVTSGLTPVARTTVPARDTRRPMWAARSEATCVDAGGTFHSRTATGPGEEEEGSLAPSSSSSESGGGSRWAPASGRAWKRTCCGEGERRACVCFGSLGRAGRLQKQSHVSPGACASGRACVRREAVRHFSLSSQNTTPHLHSSISLSSHLVRCTR